MDPFSIVTGRWWRRRRARYGRKPVYPFVSMLCSRTDGNRFSAEGRSFRLVRTRCVDGFKVGARAWVLGRLRMTRSLDVGWLAISREGCYG